MTTTVSFKLDHDQLIALRELAAKHGMSPGQFAKMRAFEEVNMHAIESRLSELIDRETMKKLIEYLMQNLPSAVYEHTQKQRSLR